MRIKEMITLNLLNAQRSSLNLHWFGRTNGLNSPFHIKKTLEMLREPQNKYYFSPRTSFCCFVGFYPASRGPSIFLDKSGRGRDLCQPPRLSLICRSSTETDESVRFETCFSRFCSVRMCLVRNCWLNTRPRYVRCAREVHSSGRFSFERCLR